MDGEQKQEVRKSRKGWKAVLVFGLLLAAIVVGLIALLLPPKEPAYNGKPLSQWLRQYRDAQFQSFESSEANVRESREAIRNIGTNAIPVLLRMLRARDSGIKIRLMDWVDEHDFIHLHLVPAREQNMLAGAGFECLNEMASNAVPELIQIYKKGSQSSGAMSEEIAAEIADSVLQSFYPKGVTTPYWLPKEKVGDWYFEAAMMKLRVGDYTNTIRALSEALKLNPTNAEAWNTRASAKIQLRDVPGAMADARRAVELDSSNEPAIFNLALCKYASKDLNGAEADFTTAIQLNTNDVNAYSYRGLTRVVLRRLDDALTDLNHAVEMSPNDPTAYRNRAAAHGTKLDYELALADISKSIELNHLDASAYLIRAQIESALKNYKGALEDCDEAIALEPRNAAAFASRASAYVHLDDFESATADLEKSTQLGPATSWTHTVRGFMRMKQDDDAGAVEEMQQAVELGRGSPESYAMLGMAQYKAGEHAEALESCRKARKLGPLGGKDDLRACVWLIQTAAGKKAEANKELEAYLQSPDGARTNEWETSIARYFSGKLPESEFLGQAVTTARRPSAVPGQVCESLYYAAMKHKLDGDRPGAIKLFQKCLDTKIDNNLWYMNARAEMRQLKKE